MKPSKHEIEEVPQRPTLEQAIEVLRTSNDVVSDETILYGLSDITEEQCQVLSPVWNGLEPQVRELLIQILLDEMDANFELNFEQVALLSLQDKSSRVRQSAIEILTATEDPHHLDTLVGVVKYDRNALVRAEAMQGVAEFLREGQFEDLPPRQAERLQTFAQSIWTNTQEDSAVRAGALQVLASTPMDVEAMIFEAWNSGDDDLQTGAITAMGRCGESEQWREIVLEQLEIGEGARQVEAAWASGELQLVEAIPLLTHLLEDPEIEAKEAVIWSLGEIGGKEAIRILNVLAESAEEQEDDELLDLIEDALANASFADGGDLMRFDLQ
jgi:HEAT repeat protein